MNYLISPGYTRVILFFIQKIKCLYTASGIYCGESRGLYSISIFVSRVNRVSVFSKDVTVLSSGSHAQG